MTNAVVKNAVCHVGLFTVSFLSTYGLHGPGWM